MATPPFVQYSKASDYENDEIIFKNQKIEDERLDISKSFIICYTNLKLSHYNFTRKEISIHEQLCEDLFLNAIFHPMISLVFHSKCHSYSFCFKVIEHNDNFIITNLKDFIICNPMFHHENESSIDLQDSFGWTVTRPKHNDTLELKLLIQKDHEISNPANKNNNDINLKEESFEYSKDEVISYSKEIQENDKCSISNNDENSFLYYQEKIENIFDFKNKHKKYVLIPNKNESINIANQDKNDEIMRIKMIGNNVERYLIYPKKLCEILNKITESYQEIIEIIDQMKTLLYTESYPILFGRISIFEQEEAPNIKEEPNIEEINENFYEGIGDFF